nr:retrovirus-related Pol polyprotein from transposon TNT 1-94 [Tanacetum cinerariifolium]
TRRALDRICLHVDTEEHELGDLGEPANYKAALLDHESDKWLDAMNVEMQSMKDNEVWDLVDLHPNDPYENSDTGYPKKTMGYSFYYPPENKVFVAQNAEFFKNSLITQEASGSLKDLKIIQEKDTQPSMDSSSHYDEDDQEIDEPQSDINPFVSTLGHVVP